MATGGRRQYRVRVAGIALLAVLGLVVAACDSGADSAAPDAAGRAAPSETGPATGGPGPTPTPPTTPTGTDSPSSSGSASAGGSGTTSGAPSATSTATGALPPAAADAGTGSTGSAGDPAPAAPSDPTPPTADPAAGPVGPGSAWRNALAVDLAQWSSTPACSSQRSAPAASPSAPVPYVVVTQGGDGRPEAHTLTVTSVVDKAAQLADLERTSGPVVSFEVDTGVIAVAIDDPLYVAGQLYGIDKVQFETAWGAGLAQGAGTRIAVIDSGVQADHPDLGRTETGGAVAPGRDFLNVNVIGDERTDSGSHGTHVAGIAGARDNTIGGIGGAPKATIVPVRVLNGGSGTLANVAAGIIWAADPALGNADVLNLSLGSAQCSETLAEALQYAVSQHATVVAAAGNCSCTTERLYPAAFSTTISGVIAVASTDVNNQHSSFSNVNDYLTISAPGSAIWSTIPVTAYGLKSGTSMASPYVAAVAALVKAKCPSYTPTQVRNRLTSTAQALGAANTFGAGLVRADQALTGAC